MKDNEQKMGEEFSVVKKGNFNPNINITDL